MFPVECVARGYLTGSGLLDYQATGEVCGVALPAGLVDGSRLPSRSSRPRPRPRSASTTRTSPSTRSPPTVGAERAGELRDLTLAIYARAEADRPRARHHPGRHQARVRPPAPGGDDGAGRRGAHPRLVSRFWPAADWEPGRAQASFDKQFVRDWLVSPESGWDRASGERAARRCPHEVVERTRARYVEAYERLTGERF